MRNRGRQGVLGSRGRAGESHGGGGPKQVAAVHGRVPLSFDGHRRWRTTWCQSSDSPRGERRPRHRFQNLTRIAIG